MLIALHQAAAAFYLLATLGTTLGLALPNARLARFAVWTLAAAALLHAAAFAGLHTLDPPPSLTTRPAAVSLMAWLAVAFALVLLRRGRLEGLAGLVAPFAFIGTLYASSAIGGIGPLADGASGSLPHLHVILASAALAMLGVAGVAGVLFLAEARQLKAKRPVAGRRPLPSLEALDRVNLMALALGFPLMTFGMLAGMLWSQGLSGRVWDSSLHATWTGLGWVIFGALVVARFVLGWRGRYIAACTTAGFVFLFFAVVGVEALR